MTEHYGYRLNQSVRQCPVDVFDSDNHSGIPALGIEKNKPPKINYMLHPKVTNDVNAEEYTSRSNY